MDQIELACPYCAGRFKGATVAQGVAQAETTAQGETVAASQVTSCPHCGRPVTVPVATQRAVPPALPVPPPPPDLTSRVKSPAASNSPFAFAEPTKVLVNRRGEAVPLRRLSSAERLRYRRRMNLAFALAGMLILAIALVVLLRIRP